MLVKVYPVAFPPSCCWKGKGRAIFVWPWKIVSVSVRYLFYQPTDEKIKNSNMERALFDWPVVLQYDVKAKYWLISRKFSKKFLSPEPSLNQPKTMRVCISSINQSNRSIFFRSLFQFCSGVFISRSYKNHSDVKPSRRRILILIPERWGGFVEKKKRPTIFWRNAFLQNGPPSPTKW